MEVALIYPPTCDPTAPYLAIPTLTGWLRSHGVSVVPIDANLEGWESLLTRKSVKALARRIDTRIAALEELPGLSHVEQLDYAALWKGRADLDEALGIEDALAVIRDKTQFFVPERYDAAVETVGAAQRLIAAAHAPMALDFVAYRTPFSLMTADEIALDAQPERNPFAAYFAGLADDLAKRGVGLVGISVAFPGQIQPAYSLAYALRKRMPNLHITVGGPALTQMYMQLAEDAIPRALGPFSSAVIFEGELALLELVQALERGENPTGLIRGRTVEDMSILPAPDFDGLPLDRYFAPDIVLPYDPSRGCYWGVCTFCHYGLAEVGTARYRERPVETVLDHLQTLQKKHGTRVFYFSQDVFSPRIATNIARGIIARGMTLRWGSDMRPERSLTPARCAELVAGGALSAALGVESAAPRVLKLIDKGIPVEDVQNAIRNLSHAGVAVEAMCFSDFPTETYREAMQTVRFVETLVGDVALFILGQFDLTHGSLIAQRPGDFGIKETWGVEGDEFKTGLFFQEKRRSKKPEEDARLEKALSALSGLYRLRRYPWAGALSTAHTMLWYEKYGKDAFVGEHLARKRPARKPSVLPARPRFNLARVEAQSAANEAEIWQTMVVERRRVGRLDYQMLADGYPMVKSVTRKSKAMATASVRSSGRRQSNAVNSTKN